MFLPVKLVVIPKDDCIWHHFSGFVSKTQLATNPTHGEESSQAMLCIRSIWLGEYRLKQQNLITTAPRSISASRIEIEAVSVSDSSIEWFSKMLSVERVQRKKLIREAEGYLDLILVFDDRWSLGQENRDVLAQRAIDCLNRIKTPQGHKPHILFLKGQAARTAGRYQEAINYLQQSSRLDPENIHTFLALGWCYKRVDRMDLAIESMETAVAIDNESAIAHYNLACYWALAEQVKMAVVHLSYAISLDEDYRLLIDEESDFDAIRDDRDFLELMHVVV